jgi:outer membrane protein TolC
MIAPTLPRHRGAAISLLLSLLAVPAVAPAQAPAGTPAAPPPPAASPAAPPGVAPGTDDELRRIRESRPQTITLGQVLQTAVHQSPALATARIDLEVAEAAVLEAAGIDDWVVGAEGQWTTSRAEVLENVRQQEPRSDTVSGSAGVRRSLPTGGTVDVTAAAGRSSGQYRYSTPLETETFDFERYTSSVTAGLSQPLLRGRGARVARAGQAQARLGRDARVLGREAIASRELRQLIDAYWQLAYAMRAREISESSLALARERLRITRAGIEAGSVAPTEALAVEQVIATRQQEVLASDLQVAERSLELRRMAGLEIDADHIELAAAAPLSVVPVELALRDVLARAMASSPEIAVLTPQRQGAEIEVEVTENGLLPLLDFTVRAGPNGAGDSLGTALDRTLAFDSYEVSAGLRFEYALGNRAARGAHRRARSELQRIKVNLADVQKQVASAAVRAVQAATAASERMLISQRTIELSAKNIEAEKARFELGRATNFDVLQRQEEYKQAQLNHASSVVDYLRAVAVIDSLTGNLLPRYGIRLDLASH